MNQGYSNTLENIISARNIYNHTDQNRIKYTKSAEYLAEI